MLDAMPQSRKLWGLMIVVLSLVLLAVVGAVAHAFWGVGDGLFTAIGTMMASLGVGHQAGQTVADRSPNYDGTAGLKPKDNEDVQNCVTMVPRTAPSYSGPLVP